jgi:hypothetical protein
VFVSALALAPLSLASVHAFAASHQAQERAARKACLGGDYAKGVNILADLFVETRDPTHIYNQGRCFEQNLRYQEAAGRFEEYLRTPDLKLSPEERAATEKHIADCREKLARERGDSPFQPAPQPAVPPTPPPAPEPKPPEPASTVSAARPQPQPAEGGRRWGLITAGIITSAVGVGGLVTGIVFNLKANSLADQMESELGAYVKKSNDQKNYRTVAWVGYGVGAGCAVAGAILIGVGVVRSRPTSETDIAFVPAIGPDQMGVAMTGGF